MIKSTLISVVIILMLQLNIYGTDYHVSKSGSDLNKGSKLAPFQTISAAAQKAEPGDEIVVHEGVYRERVNPPRGGESDSRRIVYRSADNESVSIKGSELIRSWKNYSTTVWKVKLPNSFFGDYNPYQDTIWGDWFKDLGRIHHTGEVYMNDKSFYESSTLEGVLNPVPLTEIVDEKGSIYTWYCEVDEENTTIYANFHGADPNKEFVEINVRKACFYPERTGMDYITVRGFHLSQAASQWAPPTAEQIALIGTHWSKGWIIENNVISHSKCVGISMGKERSTGHNVWLKNPVKDGATHFNEVIFNALSIGWSKQNIGSHIIRNNTISECGQAGVVGALGAVFSEISNNHIYNIWAKRMFNGSEMAGIKIHASLDVLIINNCIHHAGRGIWMDWMAQGTRISGNLLYENSTDDLFMEVNHGPYLVDNNIFLSKVAIRDWSEGGAFVHNLIHGLISQSKAYMSRTTPYHFEHSTAIAGVREVGAGDNRFYNNIFVKKQQEEKDSWAGKGNKFSYGLEVYKDIEFGILTGGNIFYGGAVPSEKEIGHIEKPDFVPGIQIDEQGDAIYLTLILDKSLKNPANQLVNTELLGVTNICSLGYENPDGSPLTIDKDYFGKRRNTFRPVSGPFSDLKEGKNKLKIFLWGNPLKMSSFR